MPRPVFCELRADNRVECPASCPACAADGSGFRESDEMATKVKENEEADNEREGSNDGPLLDLSDDALGARLRGQNFFHFDGKRAGSGNGD